MASDIEFIVCTRQRDGQTDERGAMANRSK